MRTPAEIRDCFSSADQLTADKPFYLVGIGGAGMSSLALMLQKRGIEVAKNGGDETRNVRRIDIVFDDEDSPATRFDITARGRGLSDLRKLERKPEALGRS